MCCTMEMHPIASGAPNAPDHKWTEPSGTDKEGMHPEEVEEGKGRRVCGKNATKGNAGTSAADVL